MLIGREKGHGARRENEDSSPRQQKMAVVFLAFFAILIIVLWAFKFNDQLNRPFSIAKVDSKSGAETNIDGSLVDSDSDGLTDYNEINIYYTSPYLEDSDSDGLADNQEVNQGTDPNCPTGKNCSSSETVATGNGDNLASTTLDSLGGELAGVDDVSASLLGANGEVTPAFLRDILRRSGYDETVLSQITDEQIMQSYQEAMSSQTEASVQ